MITLTPGFGSRYGGSSETSVDCSSSRSSVRFVVVGTLIDTLIESSPRGFHLAPESVIILGLCFLQLRRPVIPETSDAPGLLLLWRYAGLSRSPLVGIPPSDLPLGKFDGQLLVLARIENGGPIGKGGISRGMFLVRG